MIKFPEHKGPLHLTHNYHKANYETVKEWSDRTDPEWVSEEQKQKAIEADEVWEIQWYPDTPVGSYAVAAYDLDVLLEYANNFSATPGKEG